jgi:hypothetical protein
VSVWDATSGQRVHTLTGPTAGAGRVAFSPDGRRLASARGDKTVKLWDTETWQELRTLEGFTEVVYAVAFSADGGLLATAGQGGEDGVKLWDPVDGHLTRTLEGLWGNIYSVSFSPDGRRLAAAGSDGKVKIWDTASGQEVLTLKRHTGVSYSIAFSPDGRWLASAGGEVGTRSAVRLWEAPPDGRTEPEDRAALLTPEYVLRWRLNEVEDCEQAGQRAAARWHVERLGHTPLTDPLLYVRLASLRARFGLWAEVGLSFRERQLLLALHRELTGDWKSKRPDKADVLVAGKTAGKGKHFAIDHYPGLQDGDRYVGFNGNGGVKRERFRGRGYRILGDKGWLVRARYVSLGEAAAPWQQVRSFLKDLQEVVELFGLVVAGRHKRSGEWLGLADLLERARTEAGRKWLAECVLRVYTEEDYLLRWRRVIAERMGFAIIPDRDQEHQAAATPSGSAVQLLAYLRNAGISQKELARELGVSKSLLSQYLNGRKTWTTSWEERLNAWLEGRQARERR